MTDFLSFGEIMLRLRTNGYERFFQSPSFEATFGGGEANVAVSLCNYGLDAGFISALPDNDIGQSAINSLRALGVNTEHVRRSGERVGIYYLETGANQRASKVRKRSPESRPYGFLRFQLPRQALEIWQDSAGSYERPREICRRGYRQ